MIPVEFTGMQGQVIRPWQEGMRGSPRQVTCAGIDFSMPSSCCSFLDKSALCAVGITEGGRSPRRLWPSRLFFRIFGSLSYVSLGCGCGLTLVLSGA